MNDSGRLRKKNGVSIEDTPFSFMKGHAKIQNYPRGITAPGFRLLDRGVGISSKYRWSFFPCPLWGKDVTLVTGRGLILKSL